MFLAQRISSVIGRTLLVAYPMIHEIFPPERVFISCSYAAHETRCLAGWKLSITEHGKRRPLWGYYHSNVHALHIFVPPKDLGILL